MKRLAVLLAIVAGIWCQEIAINSIFGVPEGRPGIDYPNLTEVPKRTNFYCRDRQPGFYADPSTRCQVWHWCDTFGFRHSFICPNMTLFNQKIRGCDWWYNVNCDLAVSQYSNNDELYKPGPIFKRLQQNHARVEAISSDDGTVRVSSNEDRLVTDNANAIQPLTERPVLKDSFFDISKASLSPTANPTFIPQQTIAPVFNPRPPQPIFSFRPSTLQPTTVSTLPQQPSHPPVFFTSSTPSFQHPQLQVTNDNRNSIINPQPAVHQPPVQPAPFQRFPHQSFFRPSTPSHQIFHVSTTTQQPFVQPSIQLQPEVTSQQQPFQRIPQQEFVPTPSQQPFQPNSPFVLNHPSSTSQPLINQFTTPQQQVNQFNNAQPTLRFNPPPTPDHQFSSPQPQFRQANTPQPQFHQASSPQPQFQPPSTVQPQFQPSSSAQPQFGTPQQPVHRFSPPQQVEQFSTARPFQESSIPPQTFQQFTSPQSSTIQESSIPADVPLQPVTRQPFLHQTPQQTFQQQSTSLSPSPQPIQQSITTQQPNSHQIVIQRGSLQQAANQNFQRGNQPFFQPTFRLFTPSSTPPPPPPVIPQFQPSVRLFTPAPPPAPVPITDQPEFHPQSSSFAVEAGSDSSFTLGQTSTPDSGEVFTPEVTTAFQDFGNKVNAIEIFENTNPPSVSVPTTAAPLIITSKPNLTSPPTFNNFSPDPFPKISSSTVRPTFPAFRTTTFPRPQQNENDADFDPFAHLPFGARLPALARTAKPKDKEGTPTVEIQEKPLQQNIIWRDRFVNTPTATAATTGAVSVTTPRPRRAFRISASIPVQTVSTSKPSTTTAETPVPTTITTQSATLTVRSRRRFNRRKTLSTFPVTTYKPSNAFNPALTQDEDSTTTESNVVNFGDIVTNGEENATLDGISIGNIAIN